MSSKKFEIKQSPNRIFEQDKIAFLKTPEGNRTLNILKSVDHPDIEKLESGGILTFANITISNNNGEFKSQTPLLIFVEHGQIDIHGEHRLSRKTPLKTNKWLERVKKYLEEHNLPPLDIFISCNLNEELSDDILNFVGGRNRFTFNEGNIHINLKEMENSLGVSSNNPFSSREHPKRRLVQQKFTSPVLEHHFEIKTRTTQTIE